MSHRAEAISLDIEQAVRIQFPNASVNGSLDEFIDLSSQFDRERNEAPTITLTDVLAVKMHVDAYITIKARDFLTKLADAT